MQCSKVLTQQSTYIAKYLPGPAYPALNRQPQVPRFNDKAGDLWLNQ